MDARGCAHDTCEGQRIGAAEQNRRGCECRVWGRAAQLLATDNPLAKLPVGKSAAHAKAQECDED